MDQALVSVCFPPQNEHRYQKSCK